MATKTNDKTLLTIKVDKKLKAKAQKTVESIGLPLGTVMNGFLRQFVRDKSFTFSEGLTPTPYLKKLIAGAEKEIAEGQVSPTFDSVDDAIAYLRSNRS